MQELTYTVTNSQNKKEKINLLQRVSGYLLPGEMTALMGCAEGRGSRGWLPSTGGQQGAGATYCCL